MATKMDGVGIAAAGIGILFLYSGIKGFSPIKAFQNLILGKNVNTGQSAILLSNAGNAYGGGTFAQGGSAAENQKIAKGIAKGYGWDTGAEWNALVSLWDSESGWSNTIWNTSASCGNNAYAYGIVQACGHGEKKVIPGHGSVCPYPKGNAGNPPECGGSSNAGSQIKWGLDYIKAEYGRPTNVPHGGY